ncbi:hypothetical protein P74p52 [Thermus phage P74-26]|uniref:Uncharacterized protein n=1 Tax=Thermus phage P74-26 TaxID=2914007 RepID=A7XXM3_BP742|nr:hypothetical protein P74p52 [Thermus phage P74-26]ABU97002.1 hypothetical protein P74p52 [Thermus phage P74-26]
MSMEEVLNRLRSGERLRFLVPTGGEYCLVSVKSLGAFFSLEFQVEGQGTYRSYVFTERDLRFLLDGASLLPPLTPQHQVQG